MTDIDPKELCLQLVHLKRKEQRIQNEINEIKDRLIECTMYRKRIALRDGVWVRHGIRYGVKYDTRELLWHLHDDPRFLTLDYSAILKAMRSGDLPVKVKNLVENTSKHFIQVGGL